MAVRQREQDLVDAARALFDERGVQEADLGEIARAAGINRALVYRHFSSKEELYVLTVTRYLDELAERLRDAAASAPDPPARFEAVCGAFADFGLEFPAFLDCAMSLMRGPWDDLRERVSDAVAIRLGQSMAACLGISATVLAAGKASGDFAIDDPQVAANLLYAQGLGMLHLARIGVGVGDARGFPEPFGIDATTVRHALVRSALAYVKP